MRKLLLCIALTAITLAPAMAQEKPVSPSEFRDYAEGYTLYFERDGEAFGEEVFEPDGRTLWRTPDGACLAGVWRPHGAQVCFFYGEGTEVMCWRMLRDGEGLFARLLGDSPDAGMELRITGRDQREPHCGEPDRGA